MTFTNVYDDAARARSYSALDFPGTYFLAFRDLPGLIGRHVIGRRALDFGCGAGRSSRFLKGLGFEVTGIDISASMIELARAADPDGDFRLVESGEFSPLGDTVFDLVLCAFPFDNIPGAATRSRLLLGIAQRLAPQGRILLLGSTPEIYWHEWASFTTKDFPENHTARSGERVRTVMKDVSDKRPVVDLIWFPEDYASLFASAGLEIEHESRPLGQADDPCEWVTETTVAPWVTYILKKRDAGTGQASSR